jgi:hypothetical protein
LGLLLSLGSHGEAHAQTKDEMARADALFNAGKALTDSGQYADACAKFAESNRLAPGLGVTLYLADCYERIGRIASAWTEFRSAEGQARQRNDKRADVARARAQSLEPKLLRLTITVAPTVSRTGLEVLRDGLSVAQEELGLPVPVDPGDHVIVASLQGHAPHTFTAHLGPDKPTANVVIDGLEETAPVAPSGTPSPSSTVVTAPLPETPILPSTPEDSGGSRRWIGVGLGALGIVGIGVGTVFGIVAKSQLDQSNSGPCDKSSDHCEPAGLSTRKDAETAATASTIAFVGGGVALAAGVVLYLTAPRRPTGTGIVLAPAVIAGGGGAIVRGEF